MCMPELWWKNHSVYSFWGFTREWVQKSIFHPPTEYSLKNASFWLHPVWGTHLDDPAVTITEVLPLCPSRTNGNVGHKNSSQTTQLGQNLSHIDAYNGEEKVHTWKRHISGELDAQKIIISFYTRSPQAYFDVQILECVHRRFMVYTQKRF